MGIIERMKCCWDYRSNNNCNMRRRACVEMHSCWSFVYARDASLRPKAVYNQFSLMLSRDSVMLQDSTESFCVRRVCELSWHWASLHGTPLPQFHLILQSLFVWVLVGSASLHSCHFDWSVSSHGFISTTRDSMWETRAALGYVRLRYV